MSEARYVAQKAIPEHGIREGDMIDASGRFLGRVLDPATVDSLLADHPDALRPFPPRSGAEEVPHA